MNIYNYKIIILLYFLEISTQQNISSSYNVLHHETKKKIINNFIVEYNSTLNYSKQIILDYKNKDDKNDFFILNNQTYIIFPSNNQELSKSADYLTQSVKNYTGLEILVAPNVIRKTSNRNKNTFIQIVIDRTLDKTYQIEISRRKIKLASNTNSGINKSILVFKEILENNFKHKDIIYENIQFPLADIYYYESKLNLRLVGLIIITFIIIYITFKIFK